MKLRIIIDTEVSKTVAETMRRTGFTVCQDGSAMQIKVPNTPPISQRKVKIDFIVEQSSEVPTVAELAPNLINGATKDVCAS